MLRRLFFVRNTQTPSEERAEHDLARAGGVSVWRNKMSREELEKYIYAYGKDLFSFCCSVTGSRQEAEDLYQDTFLKMYEARERLMVEKNPKSFLMGVSVNLYRNRRRKYAIRRRILGAEMSMEDAAASLSSGERETEEQVLYREECGLLRKLVKELPDKYRIPVLLFYMEELSLEEIAGIVHAPAGTVKSRLHRAKKILKQRLEDSHYEK